MKRLKKILLWFGAILLFTVIAVVSYIKFALPNVGAALNITVERTPERIARGEYLANHVTVCIDCHSRRDWTRFSGPPINGTFGMGGDLFDQKMDFPGSYYASNITPEGISRYTDGELFRAITTGVNKEGRAIFPLMPYHYYGQMDEEDIRCIIAYVRTLKPVKNDVPRSSSDFPMNLIINTLPHKASLAAQPTVSDTVKYGQYLVTAAGCVECHTKVDNGNLIAGTEYGGGREFPFFGGSMIRSSNISPDSETGLGKWKEFNFLNLFHTRSDSVTLATTLHPDDFNSIMPWTMYGKMNDEDLKAIFAYLRTVKPIRNAVEKFTPAPKK